jgi:hypothetical protein
MSRRETTHRLACDVLVAGGGPAGVCCALAAARNGAQVVLCQDRPVLGGNASSEVRMHVVGANCFGRADRGQPLATEAREGGLIEEIRLEACVRNPQRSASMLDLILYDLCRREPNLTLLLNTAVVAAQLEGHRIRAVQAVRTSTEDRFEIAARVFVDCTGDSRLALEAGAACLEGREGREQFGESLVPDEPDSGRLGSTILLLARRHDRPMPFVAPPWARRFSRDALRLRLYTMAGGEQASHEYGYWWAEWGGQLDTVKDNERIRDELLAIVLGIWDHIKNGPLGEPPGADPLGAANWALDWFGFLPGKRESRRLIGRHVLCEADVVESRPFADTIAYGGWPIDLHPPAGVDAADEPPCIQHAVPHLYDIPLRACLARDLPNLLFAGRNLSATHVAFASTRVMATCAAVGQGVGTAAAVAIALGVDPADLPDSPDAMETVQQRLLYDDAFLIDRTNGDPLDLARRAVATASSSAPGCGPQCAIRGPTRSVHGPRGAAPGRTAPGVHRWMSAAGEGLPAWLELAWDRPIRPATVQLIFDTGLHRHLTLTHLDAYARQMHWGAAQPETVTDYRIEALVDGGWMVLAEVAGNYQRRRRHVLADPPSVRNLRITVLATGGVDHARVGEVRVYE